MPDTPPPMPTIPTQPRGAPSQGNSPQAIISLVLGIISMICCVWGCGLFLGIPAVILGILELKAIKKGKSSESNRLLSILGIIFGSLGMLTGIVYLITYLIYGIALFTEFQNNASSF